MARKGIRGLAAIALAAPLGLIALGHPMHAAAAQPTCSYLYWDDSADATDNSNGVTAGPVQPNLNIIEGDLGLSTDGTTLRAVLTLENQDFSFSSTGPGIDYEVVWTYGTDASNNPVMYATDASLTFNPSGPPTELFTFNKFQGVMVAGVFTFTQVVLLHNETGSFTSGPNGKVEVDVPLSQITLPGGSPPPTIGSVFTGTQGYTASGQGNQGAGNEFISDTDPSTTSGDPLGTTGHNYTVGQATCISAAFVQNPTIPEASSVALIAAAGGVGVAAGGLALRRRRGRARRS